MTRRLAEELRQKKPFPTLEEEVFLGIARTADAVLRPLVEVFKAQGLSPTQYNVLRILRGAGPDGRSCREIAERMVTRDPDLTRLLDRLETRGLIARARGPNDRRVVVARITAEGLAVLEALETPVQEAQRRTLGHVREKDLRLLARLLDDVRAPRD